jgi:hypothetical protein
MAGWGVFTILVFLLFEAVAIHLKIIQYNMWSFFISSMMTVVYLLIALGISYAYRRLVRKEGMVGT